MKPIAIALLAAGISLGAGPARADAVTDWNVKLGDFVMEAKLGPGPANRVMAIVQTASYEAVNAVTRRYPMSSMKLTVPPGASVDAAIAAATQATLAKLLPAQQAAIDAAYRNAIATIADGPAKTAGIAAGEQAAIAVLGQRLEDGAATPETYRPQTAPGVWVPTVTPAFTTWPQRSPWVLASASQFRPGPPPALTSATWARDYNEIKSIGAKASKERTPEQTAIAKFWEATLPPIYFGAVRSVALQPGREVTQNARLFAAASQALDDALIAVFDAKYAYNFWRPMTAIRNGDTDGNDATERDASWTPFIDTPMHPEYPCAHCTMAGALGAVLQAEIGTGATPMLTTTSYTANNAARSWAKVDDFVQEVAAARIYDGVHYRNSTEVGLALGRRVGVLAAEKVLHAR
jgi:hypothetical protein